MSERYTRKDAEAAFEVLCDATDHRSAVSWDDVGAWELDHNSAYGGYVVREISNQSGGVYEPFGSARMPAREFCSHVRFAVRAMEAAQRIVRS